MAYLPPDSFLSCGLSNIIFTVQAGFSRKILIILILFGKDSDYSAIIGNFATKVTKKCTFVTDF
jgi:hypothetical protein